MAEQVHLCPGCWKGDQLQPTVKEEKCMNEVKCPGDTSVEEK